MPLRSPRLLLRDFTQADRQDFVRYHMDARYRRLYGFEGEDRERPNQLFDNFLAWQLDRPRENHQFGVFELQTGTICGCAGLRRKGRDDASAILGIELTPDHWGRYRMAIDVASLLLEYGFGDLCLELIVGNTSSGNRRIRKLAGWFGATVVAQRPGPEWMQARGWHEIDWGLRREDWLASDRRRQMITRDRRAGLRPS